jgi:hypothetical protein
LRDETPRRLVVGPVLALLVAGIPIAEATDARV